MAKVDLDLMEYSSDVNAQSAYPTDSIVYTSNLCTGGTPIANYSGDDPIANAFDGNASTFWDSNYPGTSGVAYVGYDFGSGNTHAIKKFALQQNTVAGTFVNSIKIRYSDDGTNWTDVETVSITTDANLNSYVLVNSPGAHRYWSLLSNQTIAQRWYVAELQMFKLSSPALQSYSEATIKTEGSYSLKGVATTGASNKTLTRTIT